MHSDNNITQFINQPKSIVVGDVRYPAKIFQLWSESELNAIGIFQVITDSTNFKDQAYYINTIISTIIRTIKTRCGFKGYRTFIGVYTKLIYICTTI